MTLQDALSFRTRVCLEKQALARPSQVHFTRPPATTPMHPSADPGTSASGNDEKSRGEGVLRRQLGVENRVGGTGSSTDQRVDNRVGGEGDGEDQQVDKPVDRNRNRGSLGRVHARDDRDDSLTARRERQRSPQGDVCQ